MRIEFLFVIMPAKKNAKRGKAAPKVQTVPETGDTEAITVNEQKNLIGDNSLDATFVVAKDANLKDDASNGLLQVKEGDGSSDSNKHTNVGNGDAEGALDKIDESDEEEAEPISIPKPKARAKGAPKKNERAESESSG